MPERNAPSQLFAKKSLQLLLDEMAGEHRLKRVLGPVSLTALGVGAVIGAGIFAATGAAARDVAGPALMVSYLIAGVTCIFAALCYAEFASMAPVAGSAYTYAYTTLGELFAWIIGWDLVLEYAVGASAVANSWSGYFQKVIAKVGLVVPFVVSGAPHKYDQGHILPNSIATFQGQVVTQKVVDPGKALRHPSRSADDAAPPPAGPAVYWVLAEPDAATQKTVIVGPAGDPQTEAALSSLQHAYVNLPAILVVVLITVVLIKGISESAGANAVMVAIKVAAVLFVIGVGAFFIEQSNWTDNFAPYGWTGVSFFGIPILGQTNASNEPVGVLAGAAIIFFAYIGFDSVSTHAEEARHPQRDVPIGIIMSLLLCTVLYIGVVAVLTGMVPYANLSKDAGVSDAFAKVNLPWAESIIAIAGVAGITSVLLVMLLSAPRVFLAMARDGLVPRQFFGDVHPTFRTPWKSTMLIGACVVLLAGFLPIDALLHLTNIGTLFAFVVVCAAVLIMRRTEPHAARPFRCPAVPFVPLAGMATCLLLMLSLPAANWYRLLAWLGLGLVIYFTYGRHHSVLGHQLRAELARHGATPAGSPRDGGSSDNEHAAG